MKRGNLYFELSHLPEFNCECAGCKTERYCDFVDDFGSEHGLGCSANFYEIEAQIHQQSLNGKTSSTWRGFGELRGCGKHLRIWLKGKSYKVYHRRGIGSLNCIRLKD